MDTLYRKYRPQDFDTVVGQDAIIKTLRNQIVNGKIAHAYLFCGTRGTGKTTVAKIFARSINCPNEKNANPCNVCASCLSAIDGTNLNIKETDAAQENGIDSIRMISDAIEYPPLNGEKYKVFIIDEVHALSRQATEAFLKILETPPEYVVYILATTDPNKLPETILSRLQRYNFKRINIKDIVLYLKKICENENIEIDDEALTFIAEKSDGSMRESISKLDRCRAYAYDEKLTKDKISDILGLVDEDDLQKIIFDINKCSINVAFDIVAKCLDNGKDIMQLTTDLIWYLRNLLIVKDLQSPVETLGITIYNFDKYKKQSENISKNTILFFIQSLSRALNEMRFDENRRVIFETTIIGLSSPESYHFPEAIVHRLDKLESEIDNISYIKINDDNISHTSTNLNDNIDDNSNNIKLEENDNDKLSGDVTIKKQKKLKELSIEKSYFDKIKLLQDNWDEILSITDPFVKHILKKAKILPNQKNENEIFVTLPTDIDLDVLNIEPYSVDEIEKTLIDRIKTHLNIEIILKIKSIEQTEFDKNIRLSPIEIIKKLNVPIETIDNNDII